MKKLLFILLTISFIGCTPKYGCVLNYNNPPKNIFRGHGRVVKLDTNTTLIKIDGIIIKNDTGITNSKYVIAYGSFNKLLKNYDGMIVSFECERFDKSYSSLPDEVIGSVKGCIEK